MNKIRLSLKRSELLLLLIFSLCIVACNKCADDKQPETVLVEKPEMVNEEINKLLRESLSKLDTAKTLILLKDSLHATKFIANFYKQTNYTVTWTDKGVLNKQGDTLMHILKNADTYGLFSSDYYYATIDSLLKTARDTVAKKFDATKLYNVDLFLSNAFFKLGVHVRKGRLHPDSLILDWPGRVDAFLKAFEKDSIRQNGVLETPQDTYVRILKDALAKNKIREAIDSLEPKNEQYQKLKAALRTYKFDHAQMSWDSLKSRDSDSTTFTARLKQRLVSSGEFYDVYSENDSINLLKSVKNFQCKYNLVEDGKIGKLTFKALQQTKEDVIRKIEMNMERWRWKDSPTDKQFVWVNIPKFEMKVIEKDTLVMKSRVITGAPDHPTPLLKSTIRYFIIYPYWTVPFSIATKEILPILKRDTSYLRRKNFDVLDGNNTIVDPSTINWKRYSKTYFPWKLRQRIGDDNSLGILKFNFENKYGVYMHDTDNRRLFGREMRALSHGCCRLDKFMDFAQFLIRDDSVKYPVDTFLVDLQTEKQKYVYLRRPITIYINYFTVEVDEYMEIHFFNDVYRRDEKMLESLYKK